LSRRIATVEKPKSARTSIPHEIDVALGVKRSKFTIAGRARFSIHNLRFQTGGAKFLHEGCVAIGTKRMTAAESVPRNGVARDQ
jgi:hypothetical protein